MQKRKLTGTDKISKLISNKYKNVLKSSLLAASNWKKLLSRKANFSKFIIFSYSGLLKKIKKSAFN